MFFKTSKTKVKAVFPQESVIVNILIKSRQANSTSVVRKMKYVRR